MPASVVDLFCGAGGLSHGFHLENMKVAAGFDIDEACKYAFEANNNAPFVQKDIAQLSGAEIAEAFGDARYRVLVGCAPCQPFSTYNQRNSDPNWRLLDSFGRLIEETLPHVVSMENVPRLQKFSVFEDFVGLLKRNQYEVVHGVLYGPDYGLPQTRSRLVLLASRLGKIALPTATHKEQHLTVQEAIGDLPPLGAGDADPLDPLHKSSRLSEKNMLRMKQAAPGGTWKDWQDQELVVNCHKQETGRGYASVYGRMTWEEPSPTITTQFFGFGNGRFGHPDQDRAISLREGAMLQSFPREYKFVNPEEPVHFKKVGRMIGNAVPVAIGRAIARAIKEHIKTVSDADV